MKFKILGFIILLLVFALGYTSAHVNSPQQLMPQNWDQAVERASPSNWIEEEHIHVYSDRVVIDVQDPHWAIFTNTNSMDPVIDEHAHAIEVTPASPDQLEVGDIVAFKYQGGVVIHRIVAISQDDQGWYAITKGDNNPTPDPGKRRFADITKVLVAILY